MQPHRAALPKHGTSGSCSAQVSFYVYSDAPAIYQNSGGGFTVFDGGYITQSPTWFCGQDGATVNAQSKACGTWGCSWQTKGSISDQARTPDWSHVAMQPCRSGTNRYRTQTVFNYFNYQPQPVGASITATSAEPEFSCK